MQIHLQCSKSTLAIVLVGLLASTGCGGYSAGSNAGASPANTYAYVGQQVNSAFSISQFQVANDGTFTALNPPSVPIDPYDYSLTVDPAGKYVFTDGSENDLTPGAILQFVIGGDGTMAANSVATLGTRNQPGGLVFTPNGRYAIAANADNTVSSYALSSTGSLSLVNTVLAGFGPASTVIDSSGQFAYVLTGSSNTSAFAITEYTISSSGVLNLVVTYPVDITLQNGGGDPTALFVSPKGFLYLTEFTPPSNGTGPGGIVEFSIDKTNGGLSVLNIYSTADSNPGPLIFDPIGKYAYVSNQYSFTISQFTVDAVTGALTQNGPDVAGGFGNGCGVVDPSGKFVFAAQGQTSSAPPQVSLFAINADGTLTPNGATAALGANSFPTSIAIAQQ
jgi:6-phosphogluconolactonase (cycloisomerase 2 family)